MSEFGMKKILLCVFIFMFQILPAQENMAKIIPHDHWIYDALYALALEDWQTSLAIERPQSVAALSAYFSTINFENLSEYGQKLYRKAETFLNTNNFLVQKDWFGFDINAVFALQAQYRYKYQNLPSGDNALWYNKQPELIKIPIQMAFSKYVHLYADIDLKKNYLAFLDSYPYTNMVLKDTAFDSQFPHRAGLSIGYKFINFHIGRGAIKKGKTLAGSMLLSDTVDRLDYAELSFFAKSVRTVVRVIELKPTRFVFYHEITFKPVKQLAIGFQEAMSVNSSFDPRFLNPMMILHNYAAWKDLYPKHGESAENGHRIGTQLGLSVDAIPYKGMRLYGQFVMNQFQTSFEKKHYPEARKIPNSLGGLAGIEYHHVFPIGYFTVTAECSYTNPWAYVMDNKAISFYYSRKDLVSLNTDKELFFWLGNPYGPDTATAFINFALSNIDSYSAFLKYRFVAQGHNGILFFDKEQYYPSIEEEASIKTPSMKPRYFHTVSLGTNYAILKGLSLVSEISWTIMHGSTYGNSVDISASINYSIR